MAESHRWILTDAARGQSVERFHVSEADVRSAAEEPWSVEKETLWGGLSDGVDVIRVATSKLSFVVLPTRGMGIWKATAPGLELGWQAPLRGPVHPKFVRLEERGGLGWLGGFDEWIVRCGLESNGPPGRDRHVDQAGSQRESLLSLHGRIANLPAHRVEFRVEPGPPARLVLEGEVDESMLFFPQLRLTTEVSIVPGERTLRIEDSVTNFGSSPAEAQLLYHVNFGPPLLGEGARFLAPLVRGAPRDAAAARAVGTFDVYPGPTSGIAEEVFFLEPAADPASERTLAALIGPAGDRACALRFSKRELPCLTLWKNPAALSDGYVTGIEPGTNFPNFRSFEREKGRVLRLKPGEKRRATLEVEVALDRPHVESLTAEIGRIQSPVAAVLHATPNPDFSPG